MHVLASWICANLTKYGSKGRLSTKGDAYGYDITLMETFTKKKPMGGFFSWSNNGDCQC